MHQFRDALSAAGLGEKKNHENNKNLSFPPAAKVKICKRKREENGSLGAFPPHHHPKVRNRGLFLRKRNGVEKWNNGIGIKHPQWGIWLIRYSLCSSP